MLRHAAPPVQMRLEGGGPPPQQAPPQQQKAAAAAAAPAGECPGLAALLTDWLPACRCNGRLCAVAAWQAAPQLLLPCHRPPHRAASRFSRLASPPSPPAAAAPLDPAAKEAAERKRAAEEGLPEGWGVAFDAQKRPYFWHKQTKKVMWEKPTADTPTN